MKQITLIGLILSLFLTKSNAQEVSVEENVWGIQAGIYPLSAYNETKLANSISIRSELSLGFSWSGGNNISDKWVILPIISAEPRWYYNLQRRTTKHKRIDGNSGNYLSLNVSFLPDAALASEEVKVFPSFYIIPMYGLRRNIGKRFNFETAFGLGYGWIFRKHYFAEGKTERNTVGEFTPNIRLTVGYLF